MKKGNNLPELKKQPDFIYHSREKVDIRRHTIVGVIEDDKLKIGYAACSKKDQFLKKKGVFVATRRAIAKPINTIGTMQREKVEMKILFKDLCDNFTKIYPEIVRPLNNTRSKMRAV